MIIDYLWHSEFLATLKNSNNEEVKILSDSWLSDYVVGDMMGRNPTFSLNYRLLESIDAIFISHAHCDHLDPYTLIDLYKNLKNSPILLLPETLSFLKDLFIKYLWDIKIIMMRNKEKYEINGITVRWYIFENENITNEDDVMSLFISNETEIIYTEVDSIPPSNEETQNYLYKIFTEKKYENIVYLATRNELEWNLKLLDIDETSKRLKFAEEYKHSRLEEIEYEYSKYEYWADFKDIYKIKNFIRIFIGQWISYPKELNPEFLKLRLMTLEDNKNIEKSISSKYGYHFPIESFESGQRYEIQKWKIAKNSIVPYRENFDLQNPEINLKFDIKRWYVIWPLHNTQREKSRQEKIILDSLNNRFLPYRLGNVEDNLKNVILRDENRKYTICIKYWTLENYESTYYKVSFENFIFETWESKNWHFDEEYWANDIEDFYDGKQELYSNFLHTLKENKVYRFWTSLWANFLNNDLVKKKFELHFSEAKNWKSPRDFVLPYYKNI